LRLAPLLPYLLAGATLLVLGANAVPTTSRKALLLRERARLRARLLEEERRRARLEADLEALAHDPFVLERAAAEAWRRLPPGVLPWSAARPVLEGPEE